jgi:hypothetical protein
VFCLCEVVWLLLVMDWLEGELLCSGKLHGLEGEYKHLCVLMFASWFFLVLYVQVLVCLLVVIFASDVCVCFLLLLN